MDRKDLLVILFLIYGKGISEKLYSSIHGNGEAHNEKKHTPARAVLPIFSGSLSEDQDFMICIEDQSIQGCEGAFISRPLPKWMALFVSVA
jgi:hypothetical protein